MRSGKIIVAVRWGSTFYAIDSDLARPLPTHNPELPEILKPALASTLGEVQALSSIREKVKL